MRKVPLSYLGGEGKSKPELIEEDMVELIAFITWLGRVSMHVTSYLHNESTSHKGKEKVEVEESEILG